MIVTLVLLSVVTFLAVAFLFLSRRERGAVTTAVDQTVSRLAAEAAVEHAKAQMLAPIMASGNGANYGLLVSTNYVNSLGFQTGIQNVTNVSYFYPNPNGSLVAGNDLIQNVANLFYSPRPPVFITDKRTGLADFRFYLDLNRNGLFDSNGVLPVIDYNGLPIAVPTTNGPLVVSNFFVGDPEWIGILERPDRPHSASNKFVSRYCFLVVPSGRALDINTLHNQAKLLPPAQEGFSRDMGVGPWEMNLAAFLVDLNTNLWTPSPVFPLLFPPFPTAAPYDYIPDLSVPPSPPNPFSSPGTAFEDALALTRWRYGGGWNNLHSVRQLFGPVGAGAFLTDMADDYGGGPLMLTNTLPPVDPDAPTRVDQGWPGADTTNHFFTTQDFFDPVKTMGAGQTVSNSFASRLLISGFGLSSYDRYTFYRLLSQLGTDSSPELPKLHLNFANVDAAGNVIPNAQTSFIPWQPAQFFTNAADRLLRITFNSPTNNYLMFGVTNQITVGSIPVFINNRFVYSPALQRVLQLAANIYDASTNRTYGATNFIMPTVFRPLFKSVGSDVYIVGFEELSETWETFSARPMRDLITTNVAGAVGLRDRLFGVPLIVGAKKGFPNFNEFALQSVSQVTRKVSLRRPSTAAGIRPNETNQMYIVGISNAFAFEAWNSYRTDFSRPVDIFVTNLISYTFRYTNDSQLDQRGGVQSQNLTLGGSLLLASAWPGTGRIPAQPAKQSFQIPLSTNLLVLSNSIYRMPLNGQPYLEPNLSVMNPVGGGTVVRSDRTGQFPVPQLVLAITNRIVFAIVDHETRRILDYVHLSNLNAIRDLIADVGDGSGTGDAGASERKFWDERRFGAGTIKDPTVGVVNQIQESLGQPQGVPAVWNSYSLQVADKDKSIDAFRIFCGLTPLTYPSSSYFGILTNLEMETPYTPTRKVTQRISWQANDPLVHYTAGDLINAQDKDQIRLLTFNAPVQTLENIGFVNNRYEPWGNQETPTKYAMEVKDPGVRSSDDWDFPTNRYPTLGWLGRVHRGTPWQTVYLKASDVKLDTWTNWTGNLSPLDAFYTRPVNDRVLFDLFTAAYDSNSTRGQLNVNQTGLAAWSALLSGVIGLHNTTTNLVPAIIPPGGADTNGLAGSVVGRIWQGINLARASQPGGTFTYIGDVLAVPELTEQSPFLDQSLRPSMDDATVERLPQMLMNLLRASDFPRFTIYAYGQALRPANRSIVTSGSFFGLCTNYQVTAESATRTVVRIEGTPQAPRAVVESFNILPPD